MNAESACQRVVQPRLAHQAFRLKCLDFVGVAQCQADVVKAIEQTVFAKRLDVERQLFALRLDDALAFQVDGQCVTGKGRDLIEELRDLGFGQHDGEQAIFEAVVKKMSA